MKKKIRDQNIHLDKSIDEFIAQYNSAQREPLDAADVPAYLRIGDRDSLDRYSWKILKMDCLEWIDPLKAKLPKQFPPSFNSLITRYAFPSFEIGPVTLFANTGEDIRYELSKRMFIDKNLSEFLLRNGLLQIGCPCIENYDPICFDCRTNAKDHEHPIVQIDHEEILCRQTLRIVRRISSSFSEFIRE